MRTFIQKLGKSLMSPLSIIVAAGLMLGVVSILQNPALLGDLLSEFSIIHGFINLINMLVGTIFSLLPILFAISVAIGMSKAERDTAAFATVIGFVLFHVTLRYFLAIDDINAESMSIDALVASGLNEQEAIQKNASFDMVFGIFTYRMGILGGIVVGLWTAFIHNRFHEITLPTALSFFSGKRFVPIMITLTIPIISIIMFFIWPHFDAIINGFGTIIQKAGLLGTFIYGFLERLLIPTGLHHILNQLIRFTPVGGSVIIDEQPVSGALLIFNALLMQPNPDMNLMREATRFLTQGTHPFMVFGLPAACYAMYKTALPTNKNKVKGVLLAAGLTSFLTGITEPIEFAFIFISPFLWLFHAGMSGLSFLLNTWLGVSIGNAGGGLIDLVLFGILRGFETRWYINVAIGIIYALVYYHIFKFIILRKNIKTPGRDNEEEVEKITSSSLGQTLLEALGGKNNIQEIDNCISRLRLILVDSQLIDEIKLKSTGSLGIIKINEHNVQIVFGAKVEMVASALKKAYQAV